MVAGSGNRTTEHLRIKRRICAGRARELGTLSIPRPANYEAIEAEIAALPGDKSLVPGCTPGGGIHWASLYAKNSGEAYWEPARDARGRIKALGCRYTSPKAANDKRRLLSSASKPGGRGPGNQHGWVRGDFDTPLEDVESVALCEGLWKAEALNRLAGYSSALWLPGTDLNAARAAIAEIKAACARVKWLDLFPDSNVESNPNVKKFWDAVIAAAHEAGLEVRRFDWWLGLEKPPNGVDDHLKAGGVVPEPITLEPAEKPRTRRKRQLPRMVLEPWDAPPLPVPTMNWMETQQKVSSKIACWHFDTMQGVSRAPLLINVWPGLGKSRTAQEILPSPPPEGPDSFWSLGDWGEISTAYLLGNTKQRPKGSRFHGGAGNTDEEGNPLCPTHDAKAARRGEPACKCPPDEPCRYSLQPGEPEPGPPTYTAFHTAQTRWQFRVCEVRKVSDDVDASEVGCKPNRADRRKLAPYIELSQTRYKWSSKLAAVLMAVLEGGHAVSDVKASYEPLKHALTEQAKRQGEDFGKLLRRAEKEIKGLKNEPIRQPDLKAAEMPAAFMHSLLPALREAMDSTIAQNRRLFVVYDRGSKKSSFEWMERVSLPGDSLWLDANGSVKGIQLVTGQAPDVVTVSLEHIGVHESIEFIHDLSEAARKTSLLPHNRESRRRNRTWVFETIAELRSQGFKKIGLISFKDFIEACGDEIHWPEDIVTGHFFNLRSDNRFRDCDALIVLGTPRKPDEAMIRTAQALYGPYNTTLSLEEVDGYLAFRGKAESFRAKTKRYKDPLLQDLIRRGSEDEVVQAIERARLVDQLKPDRTRKLVKVIYRGHCPLPYPVSKFVGKKVEEVRNQAIKGRGALSALLQLIRQGALYYRDGEVFDWKTQERRSQRDLGSLTGTNQNQVILALQSTDELRRADADRAILQEACDTVLAAKRSLIRNSLDARLTELASQSSIRRAS